MVSPSENREAAYRLAPLEAGVSAADVAGEPATPGGLKRKTDLPVGTELTVHGFLAKDRTATAQHGLEGSSVLVVGCPVSPADSFRGRVAWRLTRSSTSTVAGAWSHSLNL